MGAAALATAVPFAPAAARTLPDVLSDPHSSTLDIKRRPEQAYQKRLKAAAEDHKIKVPSQSTNGDEQRYPSGIANFTKGFPHDSFGEIDPGVYASYLAAVRTGKRADFDNLTMGGNTPLVDPQSGLAFDLET